MNALQGEHFLSATGEATSKLHPKPILPSAKGKIKVIPPLHQETFQMHDFKALPHKLNSNVETIADSSFVLVCNMNSKQALPDPQIPHWYNQPVNQAIIALVGFLEAHGVKVWADCTFNPKYARRLSGDFHPFRPIGLYLEIDPFDPDQGLTLSTIYATPALDMLPEGTTPEEASEIDRAFRPTFPRPDVDAAYRRAIAPPAPQAGRHGYHEYHDDPIGADDWEPDDDDEPPIPRSLADDLYAGPEFTEEDFPF